MSDPTAFTLFKRGNGIYYVLHRRDGRRCWRSTHSRTKSDALEALTDFRTLVSRKPAKISLSQFITEYIAHAHTSVATGTVVGYRAALGNFLSVVGDIPIQRVTSRHIEMYTAERLRSIRPVTVNIELRSLKAAFSTALRWKMIEANPVTRATKVRIPEVAPAFFCRADFQKLLATIREKWMRDIVVFAAATGMRRSEILNLRWQDLDFPHGLIHIQSSATFTTKQGKRRTIPMSDVVYSLLNRKRRQITCDYVFHRRSERVGSSYLSHMFKRYVRTAKLDESLHFHSLRHYARDVARAGGREPV